MAITHHDIPVQNPWFNTAYGNNYVALEGLTVEQKYAIRILQGGNVLADLRQGPNGEGTAVFDIRNVVQSLIGPGDYVCDTPGMFQVEPLKRSLNEVARYDLQIGYEGSSGNYVPVTTYADRSVVGGTNNFWYQADVPGGWTPTMIIDGSGCSSVSSAKPLLTDYKKFERADSFAAYPSTAMLGQQSVYHYRLRDNDPLAVTYWNNFYKIGSSSPLLQSIEAFKIWEYNATDVNHTTTIVPNILINGGGPNTDVGDGAATDSDTDAITMGVGPRNLAAMQYRTTSGASATTFSLDSSTTYYYITAHTYNPLSCVETQLPITEETSHWPVRVDIIDDDCTDYDLVHVNWLNSLGFRDYFTFTKKQEERIQIKRNDFLDSPISWNELPNLGGIVNDQRWGARGTTTYSQEIENRFLVTSDYMDDMTAIWLRRLYESPDVRVLLTPTWQSEYSKVPGVISTIRNFMPVTLLSNNWTQKTYRKDKLFQYELLFKIANNPQSMRG